MTKLCSASCDWIQFFNRFREGPAMAVSDPQFPQVSPSGKQFPLFVSFPQIVLWRSHGACAGLGHGFSRLCCTWMALPGGPVGARAWVLSHKWREWQFHREYTMSSKKPQKILSNTRALFHWTPHCGLWASVNGWLASFVVWWVFWEHIHKNNANATHHIHTGTHRHRCILLEKPKTNKQTKAIFKLESRKHSVTIPFKLHFPPKKRDENGRRDGRRSVASAVYIHWTEKRGFHRTSALSSISQSHKFNKIINRMLSCRSPLIQPSQPLLGWVTPDPWRTTCVVGEPPPKKKPHLEQKFFVRV